MGTFSSLPFQEQCDLTVLFRIAKDVAALFAALVTKIERGIKHTSPSLIVSDRVANQQMHHGELLSPHVRHGGIRPQGPVTLCGKSLPRMGNRRDSTSDALKGCAGFPVDLDEWDEDLLHSGSGRAAAPAFSRPCVARACAGAPPQWYIPAHRAVA